MEPFKSWLDEKAARRIARALKDVHPEFPEREFVRGLASRLEDLELKGRMLLLKDRLRETLPREPEVSIPLLLKASPALEGFVGWPLSQYVAEFGQECFELSMDALRDMTEAFSSEFAVRPFLLRQEKRTLARMLEWTRHPSEHVRRLASEGSRPLLPWGERLPAFVANLEKTWPILEALKEDPSEYVRRSVANHLNDHSKNHGDELVRRLARWRKAKPDSTELDWVVRHATRTLVKKGHPDALALHGIGDSKIEVKEAVVLSPKVRLGGRLHVKVTLRNPESKEVAVILDHELGLKGANGAMRLKVFKGKKLTLAPRETRKLELEVPIRVVTTRRYYAGTQTWAALVNGRGSKRREFQLSV